MQLSECMFDDVVEELKLAEVALLTAPTVIILYSVLRQSHKLLYITLIMRIAVALRDHFLICRELTMALNWN